ncbi:relaxase/mobilization nuclease domain-containing protein [Olleya sp. R77988]|uniref:relaxase/mobilization nuclease domain-containing protein n=1 Tax=Olleya sp. R77988 TaxID=3093875 RepID=UPI0037CC5F8B
MIAKIVTGSSIKGLLQYLTNKDHAVITANYLYPDAKLETIVSEFNAIQGLNKRVKKSVMHIVLSFPEEEKLSDDKLKTVTEDFMDAFGAEENQWISIKHFNTKHRHCHIAINRVKIDGKLLSTSYSHLRAKEICRALEMKHGLNKVSSSKFVSSNKGKDQLKRIIDHAIEKCKSIEAFKKEIEQQGFKVLMGRGVTFINTTNGAKTKGSSIGRDYSFGNIKKRLLNKEQKLNLEHFINEKTEINNSLKKDDKVSLKNNNDTSINELKDVSLITDEWQIDLFKKKRKKRKR